MFFLCFIVIAGLIVINFYPSTFGSKDKQHVGEGDFTLDMYGWDKVKSPFETILEEDVAGKRMSKNNFIVENALAVLEQNHPNNIEVFHPDQLNKPLLLKQDLIIFSLETWKKLIEDEVSWLTDIPSVLIIKP